MISASAPPTKRRKHSTISTTSSNHPLRQTSFPPPDDEDRDARYSPASSIDNMSVASSSTKAGTKSKKSLGKRRATRDDDLSSLVSGRGGPGTPRARTPGTEGDDDDDDDDDDGEEMEVAVESTQENSVKAITARNYMIREAMDPRQQMRFDAWHASRLNKAIVKKLINQTLSQSVNEHVVFAVQVAAKLFAGEIIERARKVQDQWVAASLETQLGKPKPLLALPSPPTESEGSSQTRGSLADSEGTMHEEMEAEIEARRNATLRGPLLAEHLNEAFRRYKEYDGPDRELLNQWRQTRSTGAERFGVKNRKGRLFGGGGRTF